MVRLALAIHITDILPSISVRRDFDGRSLENF